MAPLVPFYLEFIFCYLVFLFGYLLLWAVFVGIVDGLADERGLVVLKLMER